MKFACFFVGWAISRCLSTTPHPVEGQGGSIHLLHYSMIVHKPAILVEVCLFHPNQYHLYICSGPARNPGPEQCRRRNHWSSSCALWSSDRPWEEEEQGAVSGAAQVHPVPELQPAQDQGRLRPWQGCQESGQPIRQQLPGQADHVSRFISTCHEDPETFKQLYQGRRLYKTFCHNRVLCKMQITVRNLLNSYYPSALIFLPHLICTRQFGTSVNSS